MVKLSSESWLIWNSDDGRLIGGGCGADGMKLSFAIGQGLKDVWRVPRLSRECWANRQGPCPSKGRFSTEDMSRRDMSCSGVARGAVRGTDCSLSTLPNMEKPWNEPTLWWVRLLGLLGGPDTEESIDSDDCCSLRPELS